MKQFSTPQRKVFIQLIEKKGKDIRCHKNWRPISLVINNDNKIGYTAFSERLKGVLPFLIRSELTAHAQNRFICEFERLTPDMIEFKNILNIESFLVAMAIERSLTQIITSFFTVAGKICV